MSTFRRYFLLLILSLLVLSSALVVSRRVPFPGTPGPDFDARVQRMHTDAISDLRPDLVLLGDSIVGENVDDALLSEQIGLQTYPMSFGGSASALWYLALKNNILTASHHPKYLVILFRDSTLTAPGYRVQGKFSAALDELATPQDTLVIERAYLQTMNPLELFTEKYFPPYGYRFSFRARADANMYALPFAAMRCGKRCVDAAVLNVFNFQNAAPNRANASVDLEESLLYSPSALNFDSQVEQSFLPEILRLCKENNITPIFARAKTTRFPSPSAEPPGLRDYLGKLETYLSANGARFVDLSGDPRVTQEDFIDNFHVFPSARTRYTQMLADALRSVLP